MMDVVHCCLYCGENHYSATHAEVMEFRDNVTAQLATALEPLIFAPLDFQRANELLNQAIARIYMAAEDAQIEQAMSSPLTHNDYNAMRRHFGIDETQAPREDDSWMDGENAFHYEASDEQLDD